MFDIQYDCDGNFRIVMIGDDGEQIAVGEWMYFAGIAILEYGGQTYAACSSYGMLPEVETVYDISTTMPTQLDDSLKDTFQGRPVND